MTQNRCQTCGEPLHLEGEELVCSYCGAHYFRHDQEETEKALRSILEDAKIEALANRRRLLYDAAHLDNVSSQRVFRAASDVCALYAEDPYARFYLASVNSDPSELNHYLSSVDADIALAREILRFSLMSLHSRNVLALREFVARSFQGKEADKYLQLLADEAEKIDRGVYLSSLPRDVFLCYSSKDMDKVIEIADELEKNGLKVFVASRNLRHGAGAVEKYEHAIYDALCHSKVLLFLSSESSRQLSCDALRVELPFVSANLPKMKRIEYVIERYGSKTGDAAKSIIKDCFAGLEWCTTRDDLIQRITSYLTATPRVCFECGKINDPEASHCSKCGYPLNREKYEARKKEEREIEALKLRAKQDSLPSNSAGGFLTPKPLPKRPAAKKNKIQVEADTYVSPAPEPTSPIQPGDTIRFGFFPTAEEVKAVIDGCEPAIAMKNFLRCLRQSPEVLDKQDHNLTWDVLRVDASGRAFAASSWILCYCTDQASENWPEPTVDELCQLMQEHCFGKASDAVLEVRLPTMDEFEGKKLTWPLTARPGIQYTATFLANAFALNMSDRFAYRIQNPEFTFTSRVGQDNKLEEKMAYKTIPLGFRPVIVFDAKKVYEIIGRENVSKPKITFYP